MAAIKSYTDLEQSKKLAEILSFESADMYYHYNTSVVKNYYEDIPNLIQLDNHFAFFNDDIPCWSLAALLEILDYPQLSKDKLGSGKVGWMVSAYPNDCRYDSCWQDNPIDACVAIIEKLNELKLL